MLKRFSFLISLFLLLCPAGSALAQNEVYWNNNYGTGDRLWSTASNWSAKAPDSNDYAIIDDYVDDANGPIIQAGDIAMAEYLDTGSVSPPPAGVESVLTMTGGTLTVDGWIDIGSYAVGGDYRFDFSGGSITINGFGDGTWEGLYIGWLSDSAVMNMSAGDVNLISGTVFIGGEGTDCNSTLNMSGGSLTASHDIDVGYYNVAKGVLNMTGGTVTAGLWVNVGDGGTYGGNGILNLHGGSIHCDNFSMGPVSHMDISDGVLTSNTDLTVANEWLFDPKEDTAGITPYSGTLPALVARGRVTAYDVNSGEIITDDANYPSEAGLRALVKIDYDVTNEDMTTVSATALDPNLAYNPNPFDKARSVQPAEFSLISWSAGTNAAQHDVYFGTDETAVANADTSSDEHRGRQPLSTTTYAPSLEYVFAKDYFWRIDEVNSSGGVEWPGSVWSFTADDHAVVDDFDSYESNTELYTVWDDYWVNGSNAEIFIEKTDANLIHDGYSLGYDYDNSKTTGQYPGSVADADVGNLLIGSDWTLGGIKSLLIWFRGTAGNSTTANDQMWLELEDTSSNTGLALYDGDMNNVAVEEWQEWNIDLALYDACGVNLAYVDKIHLGFAGPRIGQSVGGGTGTVYFDDVSLWPRRCRTELVATDLTDDCVTDGEDLALMAADWLASDALIVSAPPSYDPDIWLKFDEGAGQVATNYGLMGTDYNGQLGYTSGADVCDPSWITDDPCDGRTRCLAFDGTDDYVQVPELNFNSDTVTITAWIKPAGSQTAWAGIAGSREGTSPESLNFGEDDELRYSWNNDGTWDWDSGLVVPDGLWTFAGLVVEPTQATIYMSDGATWDSATNAVAHIVQTFDGNTDVGRDWDGRNFGGRIDDVRIYNKSLGAGEVLGLAGVSASFYDPLEVATNLVVRVPDPATDPNYYPSNPDIVNFRDYDVLAEHWLEGPTLWP